MQKIKKIWKMAVLITAVLLLVSVEGCKNVAEDSGASTSVAPQGGGGGSTTVNIIFEAGYYIAHSSSTWSAMTNVTPPQAGQRTAGAAVIETMAKDGYTFRGWAVNSSYNPNAASYNQQNIITTYPSTASTLVGIWQENAPNTYSLSYSWGDGVAGVSSAVPSAENNIVSGTSVTVEIPNVTRVGYRFLGWSRTANASTATYTSSNKQITITQNTVLYAVWEIIPYSITWNLDGGSISSGKKDTYTVEDSDYDLPTPTKAGFKFLGWYTTSNFTDNSKVTNISKGSAENKTFYAKWNTGINMKRITSGNVPLTDTYKPFVTTFHMSETEITQKQWKDVMGNDGYGPVLRPGEGYGKGDDFPMYFVSWYDAIVFCNKLSVKEGKTPCYALDGDKDAITNATCNSRRKKNTFSVENKFRFYLTICNKITYNTREGSKQFRMLPFFLVIAFVSH